MSKGPESWRKIFGAIPPFSRSDWRRALKIRERFRPSEDTFHLLLAVVVGVMAGLTNRLFFLAVDLTMRFTLGRPGDLGQIARELGPWQRLSIPAVGGLAAGLTLHWGLHLIRKPGTNNILEVVVSGDGRLQLRGALIKAASSLLSICTGASLGREGSVTQLAATFASRAGQLADWHPYRLRLLVACGAASGMAAAYNAPVTGAIFAAQIVLGNFSMNLFAPLMLASVVAAILSRGFFGNKAFYHVANFDFTHLAQLPWFVVLGIFSGVLAAAFLKMLRRGEDFFANLKLPLYVRLPLGGLAVGLLSLEFPDVWGNGVGAINRLLADSGSLWFLVGLLLAKLLATVATVGSGAVGGVFTPTLFLGAALGGLFGSALHWLGWSATPVPVFALVGMGGVLAATVHAPLLAIIMLFEISLNDSLLPPLGICCIVSTLVARRLHPESIYTETLRRKGIRPERESQQLGAATQKSVGDLMKAPVPPLRENAAFREIADRFLTNPNNFLPVVDESRRLVGVVALQDLKEYLTAGQELSSVIACDVMRAPPDCLTPSQKLLDVLPLVLKSELRNIPVVNNLTEFKLVGAVVRGEVLGFLSEAISVKGGG